jgi:hypothetical protein
LQQTAHPTGRRGGGACRGTGPGVVSVTDGCWFATLCWATSTVRLTFGDELCEPRVDVCELAVFSVSWPSSA